MAMSASFAVLGRTLGLGFLLACAAAAQTTSDGAALFKKHCATCHFQGNTTRAPLPDILALQPRQSLLNALEKGTMKAQGALLTATERQAVVDFLAKPPVPVSPQTQTMTNKCTAAAPPWKQLAGWNGWGVDLANTRFQDKAGLTPEQVGNLKLKWAFGVPGASSAFGQPTISDGRLFFGTQDGTVYAIDAATGCTYWTFKAAASVRSAPVIEKSGDRYVAYFGDLKAAAYAVDAANGELLWKNALDNHPVARITAAAKYYNGRIYYPISSVEEVAPSNAQYGCCTFRGSVAALDAANGKQIWKSYAIPDEPKPTRKNSAGTQLMGPAGAAIWSSPTLDLKRKAIYVATGNAYSEPHTGYTDAILAFDMETGAMRWSQQMTPGDGWNFSCINPNKVNCPEKSGPDLDFGSSPILRGLIVAGQKSGMVHALDPDAGGKLVWQVRIGKGSALGGIEWGMAADDRNVYVALSDQDSRNPASGGGLFALNLKTGEKVWTAPAPKPACLGKPGCTAAQMAPVTAIPGVVFSGSMDGHLRAYAAADGKLLWDFDTLRDFDTVNGVQAKGGSLNGSGPTIFGGMLFVNSGYGALGGMPGNVLLAFAP
jgi:polyvinyl alcohol dehydrogenase (cytochrome)